MQRDSISAGWGDIITSPALPWQRQVRVGGYKGVGVVTDQDCATCFYVSIYNHRRRIHKEWWQ